MTKLQQLEKRIKEIILSDTHSRFISKIKISRMSDCWLWTSGVDRNGYGEFFFLGKTVKAHRHSFLIFNGLIPKTNNRLDTCIMHSCDNRSCVNPTHLSLGTQKENVADMIKKGRQADFRGEKHPRSKLTKNDVLEIRKIYSKKEKSTTEIAKIYKISQSHVSDIVNFKKWKPLERPTRTGY